MATEDQLRVMGWQLPDPRERYLAIVEAKQRRAHPDLRRKIEETGELSALDTALWLSPIKAIHGRKISHDDADREWREVFEKAE